MSSPSIRLNETRIKPTSTFAQPKWNIDPKIKTEEFKPLPLPMDNQFKIQMPPPMKRKSVIDIIDMRMTEEDKLKIKQIFVQQATIIQSLNTQLQK